MLCVISSLAAFSVSLTDGAGLNLPGLWGKRSQIAETDPPLVMRACEESTAPWLLLIIGKRIRCTPCTITEFCADEHA